MTEAEAFAGDHLVLRSLKVVHKDETSMARDTSRSTTPTIWYVGSASALQSLSPVPYKGSGKSKSSLGRCGGAFGPSTPPQGGGSGAGCARPRTPTLGCFDISESLSDQLRPADWKTASATI